MCKAPANTDFNRVSFIKRLLMTSQRSKQLLLKTLGQRIKNLRKEKKMSQYVVAKKCNMDFGSYSNIENGKRNVTVFTLQRIIKVLKVPFRELFNF